MENLNGFGNGCIMVAGICLAAGKVNTAGVMLAIAGLTKAIYSAVSFAKRS